MNHELKEAFLIAALAGKGGGGGGGLPDPSALPDGTAIISQNGQWKMQDGYSVDTSQEREVVQVYLNGEVFPGITLARVGDAPEITSDYLSCTVWEKSRFGETRWHSETLRKIQSSAYVCMGDGTPMVVCALENNIEISYSPVPEVEVSAHVNESGVYFVNVRPYDYDGYFCSGLSLSADATEKEYSWDGSVIAGGVTGLDLKHLPNASDMPNGTAMVVQDGKWVLQEGHGLKGDTVVVVESGLGANLYAVRIADCPSIDKLELTCTGWYNTGSSENKVSNLAFEPESEDLYLSVVYSMFVVPVGAVVVAMKDGVNFSVLNVSVTLPKAGIYFTCIDEGLTTNFSYVSGFSFSNDATEKEYSWDGKFVRGVSIDPELLPKDGFGYDSEEVLFEWDGDIEDRASITLLGNTLYKVADYKSVSADNLIIKHYYNPGGQFYIRERIPESEYKTEYPYIDALFGYIFEGELESIDVCVIKGSGDPDIPDGIYSYLGLYYGDLDYVRYARGAVSHPIAKRFLTEAEPPETDQATEVEVPLYTVTKSEVYYVTLRNYDTVVINSPATYVDVTLPEPNDGNDYLCGVIFKIGNGILDFTENVPTGYAVKWNDIPIWESGKIYEVIYRCLWLTDEDDNIIISAKWSET